MIKPTISNAFTVNPSSPGGRSTAGRNRMRGDSTPAEQHGHGQLGTLLTPMQADLREAEFGFSLELSPIQAVDAVHALIASCESHVEYLVTVEQSAWRDGNAEASLSTIAARLGIEPREALSDDQLVLDAQALSTLVAIAQPIRLLAIAIDGPVETGDATAIEKAIAGNQSPLSAELRAVAALEVLGDRSVVMHVRDRKVALLMVAQNFRHYLAAVLDRPAEAFAAPHFEAMDHLFSTTGALSVRPIETQISEGSIDVGVSTAIERFTGPANRSLIYDRPSNSWHAE